MRTVRPAIIKEIIVVRSHGYNRSHTQDLRPTSKSYVFSKPYIHYPHHMIQDPLLLPISMDTAIGPPS
jgi:hypothetical protein